MVLVTPGWFLLPSLPMLLEFWLMVFKYLRLGPFQQPSAELVLTANLIARWQIQFYRDASRQVGMVLA